MEHLVRPRLRPIGIEGKKNHQWTRISTNTNGPPSMTSGARMLLRLCSLGVTMSWDEAHPGARASRPHKSWHSLAHLLHLGRPAAAPWLCFGWAHGVPAGRVACYRIAGKLSARQRERMRAGRPRSRGVSSRWRGGGIRRATSLKAGLYPLGSSRLPATGQIHREGS